jgi:hypothetical protein
MKERKQESEIGRKGGEKEEERNIHQCENL